MQAIVKSYLPSFLRKPTKKNANKPPAQRQRKHLRRKKPGLPSRTWLFCKEKIQPKTIAITAALLLVLLITIGAIGYCISILEPVEITQFGAKPNWTGPYEIDNSLHNAER